MENVVKIPFLQVITHLAYKTSKNNMLEAMRKEQESKSKYKK
jgi:hypothetical protein